MPIRVLALDLERTLISDANSVLPRPGLAEFLAFAFERFARVVLFTTVEEADARAALEVLGERGEVAPELLDQLGYVPWVGEHKDLAFVSGATPDEVLFVDDDAGWVRPDQRGRWVPIAPWDGGPDGELARVRAVLDERLRAEGRFDEPEA